jgi:osmoprotectant transport system permease protein
MPIQAETATASSSRLALDRLGLVIAAIILAALIFQPFALFRPNRIAATTPFYLWEALPLLQAATFIILALLTSAIMVIRTALKLRLGILVVTLIALALAIGWSATWLTPAGNNYARVSAGGAVWLMLFALTATEANQQTGSSGGFCDVAWRVSL